MLLKTAVEIWWVTTTTTSLRIYETVQWTEFPREQMLHGSRSLKAPGHVAGAGVGEQDEAAVAECH